MVSYGMTASPRLLLKSMFESTGTRNSFVVLSSGPPRREWTRPDPPSSNQILPRRQEQGLLPANTHRNVIAYDSPRIDTSINFITTRYLDVMRFEQQPPPLLSVATSRYWPHGWANRARLLAPTAYMV